MKNSSQQIDRKILKTLEPLNRLNPILLDELAAKSIIDEVPAGKIICRRGEKDSRQIYLLSGQIEAVKEGDKKPTLIKSKSALKTPLAACSPRAVTLKAKTNSTLLYIDADLLELLMSDEPELNANYEVTEIAADDADDWMLTFLQSPAFLQLPTENIQKLLTHLEEVPAKKDQVVIQQGATDDNYYIVKSGSCNVHRQPYKGSAAVLLAVLPTGSGFGEEALISNGTRNATITMREDGSLMWLKKKDFLNLLINPLISYFEHNETQKKLDEGCVVIDVRNESESKQKPLEGSVNIPLSMLRLKFDSLNAEREYLLVCDDSSQSAAAAFLMIQNGFKCNVLRKGLNNSKSITNLAADNSKTVPSVAPATKESQQVLAAKKQTQQIATQQEQIKAAREKAERDIVRHKKELAESRARIARKKQPVSSTQDEAKQLKEKAAQELAKAQAENKAIELRKKETTKNIQQAEEMMKQSTAAAEKTRKQAEEEATQIKLRAREEAEQLKIEKAAKALAKAQAENEAIALIQKEAMKQSAAAAEKARELAETEAVLIKQRAIEEAEQLNAEKAAKALAKAQAENKAIALKQKETNDAMRRAKEAMKQSAAAAEKARKQAETEAALIKQRAIEEVDFLRAEVEAARKKMEEDAVRIKKEEDIIKKSALNMRNEADKIRQEALSEAQQVKAEIEATRSLLEQKIQKTQEDEKRKHDQILAEAKKQADKIAATKTLQAATEAEAIRQKAKEDALRLHNELEDTRKQIEAEAARVIRDLKEQTQKSIIEENVTIIEEEVLVELVAEEDVDYKSVSIPGMSTVEPINDIQAKQKAKAIKEKLAQSQELRDAKQAKIHKVNNRTILEGEDDLFIFQAPKTVSKPSTMAAAPQEEIVMPVVSHRTQAESVLTQISTEAQKSIVIFPQQEQETAHKNNPFLNQNESLAPTTANVPHFNVQAHNKRRQNVKSNTLAIAASFILILAGAMFTLHATDTLKVQSIAALFNSGNDSIQTGTNIAKTKNIRRHILRADTKVNVKKKVTSKMDDIMQGWKDVLSESKNPKKLNKDQ